MDISVTNSVNLKGRIIGSPTYSHVFNEVPYYAALLEVPRTSGNNDKIHIFVPEPMLVTGRQVIDDGDWIKGDGYLVQSKMSRTNSQSVSVVLNVVESISAISDPSKEAMNCLILEGVVVKAYPIRHTGKQKRIKTILVKNIHEDTDRTVVVPTLAWNNCADYVEKKFQVGSKVKFRGRLESRDHTIPGKMDIEIKTINEVSILSILPCDE